MAIADRPVELSEQVLESIRNGEQAALAAVRSFVDTVDNAIPFHGEEPSARQKVIDAGLEMADKLVQSQYNFLHEVVRSAGSALGATPPAKE